MHQFSNEQNNQSRDQSYNNPSSDFLGLVAERVMDRRELELGFTYHLIEELALFAGGAADAERVADDDGRKDYGREEQRSRTFCEEDRESQRSDDSRVRGWHAACDRDVFDVKPAFSHEQEYLETLRRDESKGDGIENREAGGVHGGQI